jgi:Mce-associated membrane protein
MASDAAVSDTMTMPVDTEDVTDASVDTEEVRDGGDAITAAPTAQHRRSWSALRHPMALGAITVAVLTALMGWQGFQSYQLRHATVERGEYLQSARQTALNLTTIDWQHADEDVKRIMDAASGEFYDDFAQRSQPFIEVVKQAQSVSVGTVTEAALESHSASEAQALVSVSVKTSSTAGAESVPRAWRMRISVQKLDGQLKVSRVEFVP